MRAAVMWEAGGILDVRELSLRGPGPGEVSVDIHAAGVCATDLALTTVFGQPTPVVLGHEGAGVVTAVGEGVDDLQVGDHVVIAWAAPCTKCPECRRGQMHLCSSRRSTKDRDYQGSPLALDGTDINQGLATATWAQRTVIPAAAAVRLDRAVPFEVAALMGCAVSTGVGAAVRSAEIQAGDEVAVIGAGPVGMSAVLGAILAGATRVVSVDPSQTRRERALTVGASEAVNPEDIGSGFDVVIDAVGRPETVSSAWEATRRGGRITVVGAGRPGQQVTIDAYKLFHDEKRLVGCYAGGMTMRNDLPWLTHAWASGRLPIEKLIDGTTGLENVNEVIAAQQAGSVLRTILTPQS